MLFRSKNRQDSYREAYFENRFLLPATTTRPNRHQKAKHILYQSFPSFFRFEVGGKPHPEAISMPLLAKD